MRKLSWRQIITFAGISVLIALSFSGLLYVSHIQTRPERPLTWGDIFLWQVIIYGWAILFPAIYRFARRFRIERGNWRRMLPLHVLAAVLFIFAHAVIYFLSYSLFRSFPAEEEIGFFEAIGRHFVTNAVVDLPMYLVILSTVAARDYSRRFQAEQLKSSELKSALANSELQALKMQLHPHFLFNTLNSISTLMHEDLPAADRMVARLGDFLRMTLENSGEQEVTLKQEMDFVNCYLNIESVRFQDRLELETEIEPEALQARVPNLILQPIVENAIKHGVSRQIRPGKLCIRAQRVDQKLRLEVEDNGPGLQNGNSGGDGIGLVNTQARLFNLYGDNQQINFSEAQPHGLIVTLEIPFQTKNGTAEK